MKKNEKIQDSPEFQYYKDDFENFKKRMEEDKEYADLKMPEGWEQDFAKTIDDTLDGNERKRRNRIVNRIIGVAAAVVLVVAVGNLTAEQVSGEGLLEMFMNQFLVGEKQHDIYGTFTDVEFDSDDTPDIKYFSGTTLEEVSEQIRGELKYPMFHLGYLPDGFFVKEATYDNLYRVISIKLINESGEYVYFFQQMQVDVQTSGNVTEDIASLSIENNNLNKMINIYEGNQDNSWTFDIDEKGIVLFINALVSKEECIKIAENIDYH